MTLKNPFPCIAAVTSHAYLELGSTALSLLSPPRLSPECQGQPHWHSQSRCEDLRVIPSDCKDSVGWCSGGMGMAHWWLRGWLSCWGQCVGVGQKSSRLGSTSLSLQSQLRCFPCCMLLSSQHVIWTKILKDQEITSESPEKMFPEDFIQMAAEM